MHPNVITTSRFIGSDAMLIAVEGDLDLATIDRAESFAQDAITAREGLVLDLSHCTFIDPTALRALLRIHRTLAAADLDVPMAIVVGDSPVQKVLSIVGMDVPFLPTLESAAGWLELQEKELSPNASPLS